KPGTSPQSDVNFSHYEVTGGGHVDTKRLCPATSDPFCSSPAADERQRMFLDTTLPVGNALALLVDLDPETDNEFFIQAVDKAGNKSGSAKVDVFEGSLIIAQGTTETATQHSLVSSGDRMGYVIDDGAFDDADSGRVVGPGLDL